MVPAPSRTVVAAAAELRRLLDGSRFAVVFTGAGISTESGIPDFRSPGGIWTKNRPIDFDAFTSSKEARREAWKRRFATGSVLDGARPNAGHRIIADLVGKGRVQTVITQNVDGLHQASGVPEDRIVELHGNTTYATCLDCKRRHELADIRPRFEETGEPPECADCRGYVKTATISFGQPMPAEPMRRAELATRSADFFIAMGSSLVVYPAAGFPLLAKRNGAKLAILNREPTGFDEVADLVVHSEIGATLTAAWSLS